MPSVPPSKLIIIGPCMPSVASVAAGHSLFSGDSDEVELRFAMPSTLLTSPVRARVGTQGIANYSVR